MTEYVLARFARKPCSLSEVETVLRDTNGTAYRTEIIETREMTTNEYDSFMLRPLDSRPWLADKGGWKLGNIRMAIAITAPDRQTLFVDPQGYDYARYIGMVVEEPKPDVRYPDVTVQLTGYNGNAFNVLGRCRQAAVKAGLKEEEIKEFIGQATAGDYNDLLAVCQAWFDCR